MVAQIVSVFSLPAPDILRAGIIALVWPRAVTKHAPVILGSEAGAGLYGQFFIQMQR